MKKVDSVFIEDELVNSYLNYAVSVIVGRALPDVRDGLKPVHRRTLFVMKELNNYFNKSYKKSARIVGDVIGKYHPHGEIAVYDSIVRLAQSFVLRYPLIDGQGNFGSIDGDSAAAMRYTEIRMSKIAGYLLSDLDFSTVDEIFNYDNTEKYPVVLPAMFPNLLVNGSYGISVGVATNIPPHNFSEVMGACIAFINNPSISLQDLMGYIRGPDFPTSGIICGVDGIFNSYKTGKGRIILKGKCETGIHENGDGFIIITEIPYQVNKLLLIDHIALLVKNKKLDGIKIVRDESDKDGLRIYIGLLKGISSGIILNNLYSLTKLQVVFNVNMVALVNNMPKLLGLKSIIKNFIDHRKEVVYRRIFFKLLNCEKKLHLLEGLFVVLYNSISLMEIVRSFDSLDKLKYILFNKVWDLSEIKKLYSDANINNGLFSLMDYKLSKVQVQTVLDLKLSNLVKMEKDKIYNDYLCVVKKLNYYKSILENDKNLLDLIKKEFIFLNNEFFDNRKTIILTDNTELVLKDLVLKEIIIIILSGLGYIKSQLSKNYQVQRRGGKGKLSVFIKSNDFVHDLLVCDTHGVLLCFSTFGKVYWIDLYNFPLSSRVSKGIPIINLLDLKMDETISVMLFVKSYDKNKYVFMVTSKGLVKRVFLNKFENQRSNGLIAINLGLNDVLVDVKIVKSSDEVILFSNVGRAIRFRVEDVRCTSRNSIGITGIKLQKNESVVSIVVVNFDGYVITATNKGFGKKSKITDYPLTKRGGKGVIGIKLDKKNGNVVKVEKVLFGDDLLLITTNGIMSRISIDEISCTGRNTKGVFLINLSKNESLVCIKKI